MICRLVSVKDIIGLCLAGTLMISSGCVFLASLPVMAVMGGAELALKGGDIYKGMKKADEREAFDIPFQTTWEMTLSVLEDLGIKPTKVIRDKAGDGGVIELQPRETKIRIAVVKITNRVSEVGIWAKRDKALGTLIMKRVAATAHVSVGVGEAGLSPPRQGFPMGRNLQSTHGLMMK